MKLVIAVNVVNDDGQIISSDIGHIDNPEQLSSSEVVNMTKQWVGEKVCTVLLEAQFKQ